VCDNRYYYYYITMVRVFAEVLEVAPTCVVPPVFGVVIFCSPLSVTVGGV
jgi:hypothetical protein